MTTHTATPWSYQKVDEQYIIETPDLKEYVGWAENKKNAQHIVKCVNSHDELVEALKLLLINYGGLMNKNGASYNQAKQALAKVQ